MAWNINNVNYRCREVHEMRGNYTIWSYIYLFMTKSTEYYLYITIILFSLYSLLVLNVDVISVLLKAIDEDIIKIKEKFHASIKSINILNYICCVHRNRPAREDFQYLQVFFFYPKLSNCFNNLKA